MVNMPSTTQTISKKKTDFYPYVTVDLDKVPTEKISKKELNEHRKALARMEKGEEYSHSEVFGK